MAGFGSPFPPGLAPFHNPAWSQWSPSYPSTPATTSTAAAASSSASSASSQAAKEKEQAATATTTPTPVTPTGITQLPFYSYPPPPFYPYAAYHPYPPPPPLYSPPLAFPPSPFLLPPTHFYPPTHQLAHSLTTTAGGSTTSIPTTSVKGDSPHTPLRSSSKSTAATVVMASPMRGVPSGQQRRRSDSPSAKPRHQHRSLWNAPAEDTLLEVQNNPRIEFTCILRRNPRDKRSSKREGGKLKPIFGFLCMREVQSKLLDTLPQYRGRSEQSSRSSIRQELEKMNYLPVVATSGEIGILKERGVIKTNAPGTSLYSVRQVAYFLKDHDLDRHSSKLLEAFKQFKLEHGYESGSAFSSENDTEDEHEGVEGAEQTTSSNTSVEIDEGGHVGTPRRSKLEPTTAFSDLMNAATVALSEYEGRSMDHRRHHHKSKKRSKHRHRSRSRHEAHDADEEDDMETIDSPPTKKSHSEAPAAAAAASSATSSLFQLSSSSPIRPPTMVQTVPPPPAATSISVSAEPPIKTEEDDMDEIAPEMPKQESPQPASAASHHHHHHQLSTMSTSSLTASPVMDVSLLHQLRASPPVAELQSPVSAILGSLGMNPHQPTH